MGCVWGVQCATTHQGHRGHRDARKMAGEGRWGSGQWQRENSTASVLNFSDREGALFGCWPERGSAAGRNGIRLQRWRSGVRDVTATTRPGGGWSTDCRCRTGEPVRCARLRCARPHMPCFASSSCSPPFVSSRRVHGVGFYSEEETVVASDAPSTPGVRISDASNIQ